MGWGERMSKNIYVGSTRIATRNSRWQEFGTSYGYNNTILLSYQFLITSTEKNRLNALKIPNAASFATQNSVSKTAERFCGIHGERDGRRDRVVLLWS